MGAVTADDYVFTYIFYALRIKALLIATIIADICDNF